MNSATVNEEWRTLDAEARVNARSYRKAVTRRDSNPLKLIRWHLLWILAGLASLAAVARYLPVAVAKDGNQWVGAAAVIGAAVVFCALWLMVLTLRSRKLAASDAAYYYWEARSKMVQMADIDEHIRAAREPETTLNEILL